MYTCSICSKGYKVIRDYCTCGGVLLAPAAKTDKERILEALETLQANREQQLEKESHLSYNYGYVAGELSGIKKAIQTIKEELK